MEVKVINATSADCPHCGGRVTLGDDADTGHGVLLHTTPECSVFLRLEPTEFIDSMVKAAKDG